jgi:hypothetical protein
MVALLHALPLNKVDGEDNFRMNCNRARNKDKERSGHLARQVERRYFGLKDDWTRRIAFFDLQVRLTAIGKLSISIKNKL